MDFKVVAKGYCFLEGPRVAGEHIWFTDLLLGGLYRLAPDGTTTSYMTDRKHVGGIGLNRDGRIIAGGPGGLAWLDPESGATGWALNEIDGEPMWGTNDFLPDGRGGIWFGTISRAADYSQPPTTTELYNVDASGKAVMHAEGLSFANGVGLSPDGKRLYQVESLRGIFAHDVHAGGTLGPRKLFNDRKDGDGCAVDMEGGLWVAGCMTGEVARYCPDGTLDRRIALPHKAVTSVAFGGPDWRDLYVTTAGDHGVDEMMKGRLPEREASLFKARADVPGVPVAMTDFKLP